MATHNDIPAHPEPRATLGKLMLLGAGIALILIAIFLMTAGEPHPDWPKRWWIRPLVAVPLAGALWGLIYYFMRRVFHRYGWNPLTAVILGALGLVVAIWLGAILGLDGTYWN